MVCVPLRNNRFILKEEDRQVEAVVGIRIVKKHGKTNGMNGYIDSFMSQFKISLVLSNLKGQRWMSNDYPAQLQRDNGSHLPPTS